MGLRRIETITHQAKGLQATVYRDAEWDEYRVKFFSDGQHQAGADYHTDDKGDALSTARAFCWYPK